MAPGAVFAAMNYSFYLAIDQLPLGTVAAIEFIGPIVLALTGSRTARNLAALLIAAGGVYVLTDVRLTGEPAGFAWAFLNAGLFTLYIILAHRLARADVATSPVDRLGGAMLVAGVVITPARDDGRGPRLHQPHCRPGRHRCRHQQFGDPLRSGPAGDDQAPSRHLRPVRRPAPATAVVIGLAVLHQVPRPIELVGVGLVMVGVLVHAEPRSRAEPRPGGRGTERYSQPTPSSSASRSERYPGSPRRIGSAPAARTAVQFS